MKIKKALKVFLLSIISIVAIGQSDYNRYNANGKKHGYWKIFLNEHLRPTDSLNSFYYAYYLYGNGRLYFGTWKISGIEKNNHKYNGNKGKRGEPVILHGTFSWKYKNSWVYHVYENGMFKKYIDVGTSNNDTTYYNYKYVSYVDIKYKDQEGSYFVEYYNNKGIVTDSHFFRKGKYRWKFYKVKK